MNDLVPDRLDEPLTRSAMAKEAGVASTTLVNWGRRQPAPLVTVRAPNGDAMYTWRHLLDFCRANPSLHATRQVFDRYRELFADQPVGREPPQPSSAELASSTARRSTSTGVASGDGATLRAVLQDLKSEVDAHSTVVAAAAKLAEDAARVQSGLLERLQLLEATVTAGFLTE